MTPESDSLLTATLIGKMTMGLLIVLALMGLLVLVLRFVSQKRGLFQRTALPIQIETTVSLGGKHKICAVTWNTKTYLLALTPTGGFLIDKLPSASGDLEQPQKNQSGMNRE